MAVVFISPKQRQKMFLMGIVIILLLFMALVSAGVFLAEPEEVSPKVVFNRAKINLDMSIFESDQFKNLSPFIEMELQYSYKGLTPDNKSKSGSISASSAEEAREILEGRGLKNLEIKEVKVGRKNPFVPYYQGGQQSQGTQQTENQGETQTVNFLIGR